MQMRSGAHFACRSCVSHCPNNRGGYRRRSHTSTLKKCERPPRSSQPLGEKACRPQIGSGLRTRLRCRLARAAAALAGSRRGRSAIVRTGGRLATSISTHATRSASAGGCRKSGWLTTASRRLPDRRVQNVWSVNCVREIGIDNKHGRSVKSDTQYSRSYLAGGLCAPTNRKSRTARRARCQKSFRCNLKSVV